MPDLLERIRELFAAAAEPFKSATLKVEPAPRSGTLVTLSSDAPETATVTAWVSGKEASLEVGPRFSTYLIPGEEGLKDQNELLEYVRDVLYAITNGQVTETVERTRSSTTHVGMRFEFPRGPHSDANLLGELWLLLVPWRKHKIHYHAYR